MSKRYGANVAYSYSSASYIETVFVYANSRINAEDRLRNYYQHVYGNHINLTIEVFGELKRENGIYRINTIKIPFGAKNDRD